jgi:hypothetical protein
MKKLEDIPKKDIFTIPDGYFDKLPGVIQARVATPARRPAFLPALSWKVVLPAAMVVAAGFFWLINPAQPADAESILASVETHDLMAYLNESEDMSLDDVLESVEFTDSDVDEIENEVYVIDLGEGDIDNLMNDLD